MQPTLMLPEDIQKANEYRFARHHVDRYMREFCINDPDIRSAMDEGVQMLQEWAEQEFGYESKRVRINALKAMDLDALTVDIIVASAYCRAPDMFTSFTAQVAGKLGFDDKLDSIKTVAEITAVLCNTDLFDLVKNDRFDSLKIVSNIELPLQLEEYMQNCAFLPPLVCKPKELLHNRDTPYLTIPPESRILNKGHHNEDISLDVINSSNSIALSLNTEFLCLVEETPNSELDSPEKVRAWGDMKVQSYEFYTLMAQQGNKFYLDNKVDKRGRMYAVGYHISTQGTPFKKAMLEFHNKEVVNDVPDEFKMY